MNRKETYLLLFIVLAMLSCSKSGPGTEERNYYFEISTRQSDKLNMTIADFLTHEIPKKRYTITYQSGLSWPYYAAIELDETISIDSLMPPHWFLHKMIPRENNSTLKKEDHLVRIQLMQQLDTALNYQVDIYVMDSTALTLSATTGIHFVDSAEFTSRQLLFDYYLKSIIRDSFK